MSTFANLSSDCLQELPLEGGLGLSLGLLGRRRGLRRLLSFSLLRLWYYERLLQGDGVVVVH